MSHRPSTDQTDIIRERRLTPTCTVRDVNGKPIPGAACRWFDRLAALLREQSIAVLRAESRWPRDHAAQERAIRATANELARAAKSDAWLSTVAETRREAVRALRTEMARVTIAMARDRAAIRAHGKQAEAA